MLILYDVPAGPRIRGAYTCPTLILEGGQGPGAGDTALCWVTLLCILIYTGFSKNEMIFIL